MKVQDVLRRLEERGVQFVIEGEHLRCRAPKGVLTPAVQAEIAGFKSEIVGALRASLREPEAVIPRTERGGSIPLSFAQERLWFLHQLEPHNAAYNITACCRSPYAVPPQILQDSLRALAMRHESLRTTFVSNEGKPFQHVASTSELALRVVDLSADSRDTAEAAVTDLAREQAREPFDLAAGPLCRAMLVLLPDSCQAFVLTVHHIVADGWSLGVLVRELGELCDAATSQRAATLPELTIQYADYAVWQRNRLTDEALAPDIAYWKTKLEGSSRLLDLPLDRPRPPVQGVDGAVYRFALPPAVSAALKALCVKERASLFMVLLTVYKALLFRYTRSSDIIVGSPITTRNNPELEHLVGMLVNTVVLRTNVSGELSARELLGRIRETVLEAHGHVDLPFEQLIHVLRPERSRSHSSLFQVSFVLQNTPHSASFETLSVSPMFDLSLYMWDGPDGIGGALEYRTELFDRETIARMAGHYVTLASAVAADLDRTITAAPILTDAERSQVLEDWNRTATGYPPEPTIHQLVAAQLDRRPDRIAVRCGEVRRTCAEVRSRAAGVRQRLRAMGIGQGDVVALYLERSADMPSVLLAVLESGAAYLPLDPLYPADRLAYMLEDSGARMVIADREFASRMPTTTLPTLWLDPEAFAATDLAAGDIERTTPDDLAYILYTSGSTGRPKGVEITHRSVVNLLESMRQAPGLATEDRLLAVTTLCFDIAGVEMYLPLLCHAELVIAPRSAVSDPGALRELLRTEAITVMQATPATWRMLLDAGWTGRLGFKILSGGEAMNRGLADRLLAGGAEVWNLYGPTETTIYSTTERVTPGHDAITVGVPLANTTAYILDSTLQLQPSGITGELYLAGDGLARGYRNRPDLTAAAFVADPFVPGRRMYRTGDLARWRPDGRIELLGRTDHQVKIRGYRVELDEIANVVRQHADVLDAAVTVYADNAGESALACYVVAPSLHSSPVELRKHLATRLPDYMVPASVTFLDALPQTANGKLDRKGLPAPVAVVTTGGADALPHDRIETQLVSIWEQVLGVQGIGIDDSFFDVGGHSLLAMKLFAQLERVFGSLPISLLFEAPTVRQMARRLSEQGRELPWRSLVAIQSRGTRPAAFLVPGISGNVLSCTKLVAALGTERPVYGLHAVGLDGKTAPLESLEAIASHYVSEIRSAQPSGPYHLAGVCIGGAIAFEIAQQLKRAGEPIASLTMIDTWPPTSIQPPAAVPGPVTFFAKRVRDAARTLWHLPLNEWVGEICRKLRLVDRIVREHNPHEAFRIEMYQDRVEQANYRAMSRYHPKPYAGNVVLIAAEGRWSLTPNDPRLLWTQLAEGSHVIHRIDTTSAGRLLKEPFVAEVAKYLSNTFAAAEGALRQPAA